jgi:hypothetical protein
LQVGEELVDLSPAGTCGHGVSPPALRFGQSCAGCLAGLTAFGVEAVIILFGQLAFLEALDDVVDGCVRLFHCTVGGNDGSLGFG